MNNHQRSRQQPYDPPQPFQQFVASFHTLPEYDQYKTAFNSPPYSASDYTKQCPTSQASEENDYCLRRCRDQSNCATYFDSSFSQSTTPLDSHKIEMRYEEDISMEIPSWIPEPADNWETLSQPRFLQKPVAIPQIGVGSLGTQMPFMRAYSPALLSHGIDLTTFIAFLDNLNVAQAAPAPLKALNLVGTGIGFVPHHWAQLASQGIGLASGLGSAAISKGRTRWFLDQANKLYFGPRGLKTSLYNHSELNLALRLDETYPVLSPLESSTISSTIVERRCQALADYVSPLTLDVPPPTVPSNLLDKLAARQLNKTTAKSQKKLEMKRQKDFHTSLSCASSSSLSPHANSINGLNAYSDVDRYGLTSYRNNATYEESNTTNWQESTEDRMQRSGKPVLNRTGEREIGKKAKKATAEVEKRDKKMRQQEKKRKSTEEKELKAAMKLTWLVIQNI